MTTIRTLIRDAFREAGIVATEEDVSAEQQTEALRRVNTMYRSLFGAELGENLPTVNYGQNGLTNSYAKEEDVSSDINTVFVPDNVRIVFNTGSATSLFLSPKPQDGARVAVIDNGGNFSTYNLTLNGNGRQIEDSGSVTLNTDGVNREWFYRADLGDWVRVTELGADDESPLPSEFDDYLVTLLAFRLNPRYGATTDTNMTEVLKRIKKIFKARYKQSKEQPSEMGLYRLTGVNGYWVIGTSSDVFNRGKTWPI